MAHARADATPSPFPEGATLLVAGPEGGRLDGTAEFLAPLLARTLPSGTALRRERAGGEDGVTGCNQFEARVAPDGATVLLLPGEAALAWLVGDPRARFDTARFIPVLAEVTPSVLVSRRRLADVTAAAPLRVAAARPDSLDLTALLGLDLLQVPVRPVFGLAGAAAQTALAANAAEALLLTGAGAAARADALGALGLSPVLTLGLPDEQGNARRDPHFAEVPALPEELAARQPAVPLLAAWQALAAAAQLGFLMVLQSPAPAAMVALWRQAATQAVQTAGSGLLLPCPALNRFAAPLAAEAGTLAELRRFMASRYDWHPA